jgi:hypothetical protein
MKKTVRGPVVLALILILSLTACPTFTVTEDEAAKVIALINAGDADTLASITAVPFLLDGEIIALEGDALILWKNLKEAGVTMNNARIESLTALREDDWQKFSSSWEVSVFFKKYVPKGTKLAEIDSDSGKFLLLLDGKKLGRASIIGLKGL